VDLYMPDGLTEMQMQFILLHEFGHFELLEISWDAGSFESLQLKNPALAQFILSNRTMIF